MKFEKKHEIVIDTKAFFKRQMRYSLVSISIMFISLLIGILGYKHFAGLGWTDSLLNASMILTGMGPVSVMSSDEAKIFASIYALYSGVAFLGITAVLITPIAHRILHIFHAERDENKDSE